MPGGAAKAARRRDLDCADFIILRHNGSHEGLVDLSKNFTHVMNTLGQRAPADVQCCESLQHPRLVCVLRHFSRMLHASYRGTKLDKHTGFRCVGLHLPGAVGLHFVETNDVNPYTHKPKAIKPHRQLPL